MSKRALDADIVGNCEFWTCLSCNETKNLREKDRCKRCRRQKGSGKKAKSEHGWAEAVDPATKHIYYYNTLTQVSQWTRPSALDDDGITKTKSATGWFGRGKSDAYGIGEQYVQNNEKYLQRPARRNQATPENSLHGPHHVEHTGSYNIWYGTYSGESNKKRGATVDAAIARCVVELDAGRTKADQGANLGNSSYFCLHFAKGTCFKGADCTFFHRIPIPADDGFLDNSVDCFGRARHAEHRDDMEGTGSFNKPSRTLYVGQLKKGAHSDEDEVAETLWRHFGEWGEVENVSVLKDKPVAFVRYRLRASAEFAKEAMKGQSLDRGEVLAVKWAYDDPDVKAQKAAEEADLKAAVMVAQAQQEAQQLRTEKEEYAPQHEENGSFEAAKKQALSRMLGI